jgi:hypothetical protein
MQPVPALAASGPSQRYPLGDFLAEIDGIAAASFKHDVDPMGLLNPGTMPSFSPQGRRA